MPSKTTGSHTALSLVAAMIELVIDARSLNEYVLLLYTIEKELLNKPMPVER